MASNVYCENSDLSRFFTAIDEFDSKIDYPQQNFIESSTTNLYEFADSGYCGVLYIDGVAQTLVTIAPANNGEWRYIAASDTIQLFTTGIIANFAIQGAPLSWENAKTEAIKGASERLESELDIRFPRPLPYAVSSKTDSNYDFVVVKATALFACLQLIQATDPTSAVAVAIQSQLTNIDETGLLDKLNAGKIKLSFELTESDKGEIKTILNDAATTGYITDVVGHGSQEYEIYLITIGTGGTLAAGTLNSTVTYSVKNSQGNTLVDDELITGYFQTMGTGIQARFSDGVYTATDSWSITSQGVGIESSVVRTIRMRR